MRLAFDLDDTLIPCGATFPVEAPRWPLPGVERLRVGAPALLRALRAEGHAIWVYTSSHRSVLAVRWTFLAYGVWLGGVINEDRHQRALGPHHPLRAYKVPAVFGIDLLFDDLKARPDPAVVQVSPEAELVAVVRAAVGQRGQPSPSSRPPW